MRRKLHILTLILILSLALVGCYRIDVEQGNIINVEDTKAISNGMSQSQVVKILGYPLLKNIYADHRMIYVYTIKPGHGPFHEKKFLVYFQYDKVTSTSFSTYNQPGK